MNPGSLVLTRLVLFLKHIHVQWRYLHYTNISTWPDLKMEEETNMNTRMHIGAISVPDGSRVGCTSSWVRKTWIFYLNMEAVHSSETLVGVSLLPVSAVLTMKRHCRVSHVSHKYWFRSLKIMVQNSLKPLGNRRTKEASDSRPLYVTVCCFYECLSGQYSLHIPARNWSSIHQFFREQLKSRSCVVRVSPITCYISEFKISVFRQMYTESNSRKQGFNWCSACRCSSVRVSSSQPQLNYVANGGGGAGGSASGGRCDQGTQTPENISRETRNFRLRSLKLHLSMGPSTLNLR
jgi:hypothetical protein